MINFKGFLKKVKEKLPDEKEDEPIDSVFIPKAYIGLRPLPKLKIEPKHDDVKEEVKWSNAVNASGIMGRLALRHPFSGTAEHSYHDDAETKVGHNRLSAHYDRYTENNSAVHHDAIGDYTGQASTFLNHQLYEHKTPFLTKSRAPRSAGHLHEDANEGKLANHVIKHLDEALKMHTAPDDIHVYSGVHFNPAELGAHFNSEHGPVTQLHLPAYTSTSLSHRVASEFGETTQTAGKLHNNIIKIHVPKGSHGGYVGHVSDAEASEKEFLIHRGAAIHILHKPVPLKDNHGGETGHLLWHARLIHDGVAPTKWYEP